MGGGARSGWGGGEEADEGACVFCRTSLALTLTTTAISDVRQDAAVRAVQYAHNDGVCDRPSSRVRHYVHEEEREREREKGRAFGRAAARGLGRKKCRGLQPKYRDLTTPRGVKLHQPNAVRLEDGVLEALVVHLGVKYVSHGGAEGA